MTFKTLYKLIKEQDEFRLEHPRSDTWYKTHDAFHPNANQRDDEPTSKYLEYDEWDDYLEYEDIIELSELESFIAHFDLTPIFHCKKQLLNLTNINKSYWLKYDSSDETYNLLANSNSNMEDELSSMNNDDKLELLGVEEEDVYISGWESTIRDAREYPGTVYHYTTEEKWEGIQEDGYQNTSSGTGITNRFANGIFASVSPETYADGTYGDVLLAIDLHKYKEDYKLPKLDVEPEPDVLENAINSALYEKLGLTFDEYDEWEMSPETIIVGHSIPVKYITRMG